MLPGLRAFPPPCSLFRAPPHERDPTPTYTSPVPRRAVVPSACSARPKCTSRSHCRRHTGRDANANARRDGDGRGSCLDVTGECHQQRGGTAVCGGLERPDTVNRQKMDWRWESCNPQSAWRCGFEWRVHCCCALGGCEIPTKWKKLKKYTVQN